MKTIITYILLLLPLLAFCGAPVKTQGAVPASAADTFTKKFQQNELNFEATPDKVMEDNARLLDDMVMAALANDIAAIDLEDSPADELARVAFLNWAYSDDAGLTSELLFKAARGGNAASCNALGILLYYNGEREAAGKLIHLATQLDPFYLPALYNLIMLQIAILPEPNDKTGDWINRHANAFYTLLSTRCDPEHGYSVPDYRMLEIITDPRVREESYANLKYYMRGHGLLTHIRKVLPDYNPPVNFKKD